MGFNPTLFAEFSDGWDVGIEQPLFDGLARITATYFNQNIDDLIAFDLAAFTFVNVQEFSTQGVEIALDAYINEWLSIAASYTYTDAVNLSTTLAAGNQPNDKVSIELAMQPTDRLSLSAGGVYNGAETDGAVVLDDFFVLSLRASYAVSDHFDMFARVENATDADYQDNFGYGTAPASVFGGIRARF